MEKQLNCAFLLPLENIALRRVIVSLWKQTDVLALFDCYKVNRMSYVRGCLNGEYLVKNRLSNLGLPKTLLENDMVPHLINRIGMEIVNWFNYHERILSMSCIDLQFNRFLEKLCWTSKGTVNHQKTAKELINCKILTTYQCIQLAIYNCLTDYIPVLWEELPEEGKDQFNVLNKYGSTENLINNLLFDKTGILDIGPIENATNMYQLAFERSALEGKKAATEYFYQKLTIDEREVSLFKASENLITNYFYSNYMELFHSQNLSDVFCYLLSQMGSEQQMELLKKHPFRVLLFFLQWPWESLFVDTAELIWDFLPLEHYNQLLTHIYDHGIATSNVVLFRKFFLRSPSYFQDSFINKEEWTFEHFLYSLFSAGDVETVKFIFRNIDASREKGLDYCQDHEYCDCYVCIKLTQEMRWQLVKLCVQETMLSKEEREIIEEFSKQYVSENFKEEWEQLFYSSGGSIPDKGR